MEEASVLDPGPPPDESLVGHALVFSDITFAELGVDRDLLAGLEALGFKNATEVQKRCYQPVSAGKDILVQSKTGSGKTAAFGVPLMQRMGIHEDDPRPRMLALCPTRELASQVERELNAIGTRKGLRTVAIYGGVGFGKQNEALARGVDIVVGTPGRIMDQVEQKNLDLSRVHFLVLDEADEMLSMGFWDDVMWLLKKLPKERQTLLFSATIPFPIERAARSFLNNAERIDLSGSTMSAAEGIKHYMYMADERLPKPRNMLYLLELERPTSCIIFCNTRSDVELLSNYLGNMGYDIEALSGDLSQAQRERVLGSIKGGKLRMMVATDVAARGIDISNLSHVFNYSLPEDPEVYIHRAGRTGRIGKKGICVSLVSGTDEQTRTVLKRNFAIVFDEKTHPAPATIQAMRTERIVKQILELAEQAEVSQHLPTAEGVLQHDKAKQMVAFLLKQYLAKSNRPSLLEGGDAPEELRRREEARKPREQRGERGHGDRGHGDRGHGGHGGERHEPRAERHAGERPSGERPSGDRQEPRPERSADEPHRPRKVFVNLGELDGMKQGELTPLLAGLAGVAADAITDEEVRKTSSFVRVSDAAFDAVTALSGKDHNGKPLLVEKARRR